MTAVSEVQSDLEGVVAFATGIAEPDRAGGALRHRGVDIEELVGAVPFEQVWGLLVDGPLLPGMPPAEPHPLSERFLIRWRGEADPRTSRRSTPTGRARHQRRVLVGGRARLRGRPAGAVHAVIHLRPHRRLVSPHPRAEA